MRSRKHDGLHEIEAIVYRLFAEKQFALALLALVMVGQLLTAQFLLLRMSATNKGSHVSAPLGRDRVDVVCQGGTPRTLAGAPIAPAELRAKKVVVHLPIEASACLGSLEASDILVGIGDGSH
jgi:hypothetical protein